MIILGSQPPTTGTRLYGYDGLDFSKCNTRDAVFDKLQEKRPDISTSDYHVTSTNLFKNEMRIDDLVIISHGNTKFRAIAKVVGDYEHRAPVEYGQLRRVEWLYVPEESQPYEMISKKRFSQMTLYEFRNIEKSLKVAAINELLSGTVPQRPDNHVLIIDEINRGNISKIMGELITLLEKDKRIGEQNALTVTLPYSGKAFGVPPNLFIIGTMNTADRSIALMDTALRRRFHFKELMPDPSLLREKIIDGVDTAKMLIAMNDRIELLFDRDHQIGHSFFIKDDDLEDLKRTFLDSVIPLLQEYFYGDWEKICIVLGCAHEREGSAATRNAFPIIRAEDLSTDGIPPYVKDDYDDRLRYDVNSAFICATRDLAQYFQGIYDAGSVRRNADTGEA